MEAQFRNVPDALWEQIAPIIPGRRKNTLRGRPPVPDREVLAGIVYQLRTGCQWKWSSLCLDKGYDYTDAEAAVRARRISPHIWRIGEQPLLGCVQGKPRRWVVERTNAWHNRFRGLLVRWERIGAHYHGLLHLACALIAFRQAR